MSGTYIAQINGLLWHFNSVFDLDSVLQPCLEHPHPPTATIKESPASWVFSKLLGPILPNPRLGDFESSILPLRCLAPWLHGSMAVAMLDYLVLTRSDPALDPICHPRSVVEFQCTPSLFIQQIFIPHCHQPVLNLPLLELSFPFTDKRLLLPTQAAQGPALALPF